MSSIRASALRCPVPSAGVAVRRANVSSPRAAASAWAPRDGRHAAPLLSRGGRAGTALRAVEPEEAAVQLTVEEIDACILDPTGEICKNMPTDWSAKDVPASEWIAMCSGGDDEACGVVYEHYDCGEECQVGVDLSVGKEKMSGGGFMP